MSPQPKKVRFDGLDVTAMVAYLQTQVIGKRVVNIYNDPDNAGIFWFKLDGSATTQELLVVESGVRFHLTCHRASAVNTMPSQFCMKLRKHIRGLRLEQVQQLGQDRVVLFQFGVDSHSFCLILELYSKGNLILVDANQQYTILALLRTHAYNTSTATTGEDESGEKSGETEGVAKVQVGHVYPVTLATTTKKSDSAATEGFLLTATPSDALQWIQEQLSPGNDGANNKKKKGKKNSRNLKWLLLQSSSGVSHHGPALLEHCLWHAGLTPTASEPPSLEQVETLQTSLRDEAPRILRLFQGGDEENQPGYLLYRLLDGSNEPQPQPEPERLEDDPANTNIVLEEFQPHVLLLQQQQHTFDSNNNQRRKRLHWKYDNFSQAVDVFFSRLVDQRRYLKAHAMEQAAEAKLQKIQQDQQDRVTQLQQEQEIWQQQAITVQRHAQSVESARIVINSALDSGMDWDQLQDVIRVEQEEKCNPIALLIQSLDLEENIMTLRLETDGEDEFMDIPIDLAETAHGNANRLFGKYCASKEKAQKTVEAATQAFEAAQENALRQLNEAKSKQTMAATVTRKKTAWYEKFHWFITSDNYLVVAGRDAQQNELLVKRYLRPGDAYLHADVHGASSCILRAKRRRQVKGNNTTTFLVPLSQRALEEAGQFTICHSSAWSKKMVFSAWWVEAHQVSKTAPTGEYLTTGSFMIRGKKNFLTHCPLEMGLAVLFRLGDDDSIARHSNERRDFALLEEANEDDEEGEEEMNPAKGAPARDGDQEEATMVNDSKPDENHVNEPEIPPISENITTEEDLVEKEKGQNDADSGEVDPAHEESIEQSIPEEDTSEPVHTKPKKGLSVKERKLIKRYGSLEEAQRVLAERENQNKGVVDDDDRSTAVSAVSDSANRGAKGKRGKKGKMKKLMKYADQDDEDRELAMQALQGGEKSKKQKKKGSRHANTEIQEKVAADTVALLAKDSSAIAGTFADEVRGILGECVAVSAQDKDDPNKTLVRWEKLDGGTLEQFKSLSHEEQVAGAKRLLNLKRTTRVDNFSSSLGGIIRTIKKYGHANLNTEETLDDNAKKRKTKEMKEEEERKWKQAMAEEGVVDVDLEDGAVDDTTDLGKLTGKPHVDDTILYAVAVCAPYHTLSQYTYRVKLTPGNMKRGKAAKQCVEMFQRDDQNKGVSNHDRFKEFIKKVPDNDWMQAICSDVKITAAGASKLTKQKKAQTKKARKKK